MRLSGPKCSVSGCVLFVLVLGMLSFFLSADCWAKVYIDINSPAFRKLPIAVTEFGGSLGRNISTIIQDDLEFTGIFHCLDRNAFIETSSQPFNPKNWSVISADAVVKGVVTGEKNLKATVSLFDVSEGREILRKEYQADASLARPLAHTIANDIFSQITGESGVFRTRIAFVGRKGSEDTLSIMDWDGYRTTETGVKGSVLLAPHWSRDGSKLLYSSERYRQWGIYQLNFKTMSETRLFSSGGINMAGDFSPGADEFLLSSSTAGTPDIYTYTISTSRLTRLTSSRGIDVSPSLSPDGNTIAFVSDRDGSPQLFIMDRDGHSVRRLTFGGSYNTSPSWSPKGDRIVFSGRQGGINQIFIINPDGSGMTQLTERGNNEDPSFSPDGRYIVFSSDRDGQKGVYIMRANGEAQRRITPKDVRAFAPRWSPF